MENKSTADIFGPSLFNLVDDLFVIFNANYELIDISPSSEKILGFKPEEIVNNGALEFIHPLDQRTVISNLEKIRCSTDTIIEEVFRTKTKSGDYKYIRLKATHHPHLKDHFIAIGKDVHEEYLQIHLMKSAATPSQAGSWHLDLTLDQRIWSRPVYDILEIPYGVTITKDVVTKLYSDEETKKMMDEVLEKAINLQQSWDIEIQINTFKNHKKWIRSKGTPVVIDGKTSFIEGILFDIHQKKTEELALQKAFSELDKIQQGINNHFLVSKITAEGIFLFVNHNFEILTGYHREEIIGKHFSVLHSDFNPPNLYDHIFIELMGNKKWHGEICHTKKNGESYWLDMTITPILDTDKKLKEIVIISYDITEKKLGEEKLKVLIERLEYVLKGIDAGIWDWVDINQKFVYWSPKTYELFGYGPGEIQPTREFVEREVHPEDLPIMRQMFHGIIKNKITPNRIELRLRVKSGEYRWFQSHTFLVTDSNDNPKRLIGSLIDINERKKIEGELAEETRKSVQSSKLASIGEIAAGVAHEVNNPLTIIFGFIKIIEEELKASIPDRDAVAQAIETIKQAASRAAKIVTGLRDFSRDGATDPFEDIRVTEILDMALTLCRERFKKNGVELRLDLRTQKYIHCRRIELSQVFLNLVMNAFDAVKGLEAPWIQVTTQDVPDFIEILITDSGSGIHQAIQDKIFHPFFTTKRFGSGTGLGLSIAKNIITTHHGDIFYDPSSKNTCFVVRLPKDFIL